MRVFIVKYAIEITDGVFSTRGKAQEFIESGKGTGGYDEYNEEYYDVVEYEVDNPEWSDR